MKGLFFMKKILILFVLAVITICYINSEEYVQIPSTSIRLRVIAASNNSKDQKDKIKVKNAVIKELNKVLYKINNYSDVEKSIEKNIDKLNNVVQKTLSNNDIEYGYTINYGLNYFPEKTYKGITYESGNYQSLVISLDEGKGENWWCALYPPLCQIDENIEDKEYSFLIKKVLSQYN